MTIKWLTFVLAGFSLIMSPLAPADNLVDVYQLAETKDPELLGIIASHQATLEQYPQARAQLLPSLRATTSLARRFGEITDGKGGVFLDDPFTDEEKTLSLTQPLFRYDRWVQLHQADTRIQQAAAEVDAAHQDLGVRVSERYFDVLAAQDELVFSRAAKNALQRQLDQTKLRFEVGIIAITDVQEAQAGYDLAVAQEILAQNQLDNAYDALREITGAYHKRLDVLTKEIPLILPSPADIEQWTARALAQNLRISAATFASQTAYQEIRRQQAGHLPTVDIVASHGTSVTGGRFAQDALLSGIGVELNVPIFEGGIVVSRTHEAEHRYTQALEEVERQKRAVQRQARDAYLGVVAGISRVKALKQAVVSNETLVEASEAGFEVGTRTTVDVVAAQRELFRARRDYSRARYDYLLDTLRLKRASSTLAPADLAKINAWLGP
ncbi:MAG: TolC family outer membrane protein [Gammaproteobacteria bacterium]